MLDLPQHFAQRVSGFEQACARLARRGTRRAGVVFLGDSLVEYYKGSLPWVNRGICSDHLQWPVVNVLERLGPDRLHPNPQAIVSLVGINDLNDDPDGVDRHAAAYGLMLGTLGRLYPSARLVVCSLLPTAGPYAHLNPAVAALNQHLSALAVSAGAGFLNLHQRFLDPATGTARQGWLVDDGLHLSRRGYSELTALIEAEAMRLGLVEESGTSGPRPFRRRPFRTALPRAWQAVARRWPARWA